MPLGNREHERIYFNKIDLNQSEDFDIVEALLNEKFDWIDVRPGKPLPLPQETENAHAAVFPNAVQQIQPLTEENLYEKTLSNEEATIRIRQAAIYGMRSNLDEYIDLLVERENYQNRGINARDPYAEYNLFDLSRQAVNNLTELLSNEPQYMSTQEINTNAIRELHPNIVEIAGLLSKHSPPGLDGRSFRKEIVDEFTDWQKLKETFAEPIEEIEEARQQGLIEPAENSPGPIEEIEEARQQGSIEPAENSSGSVWQKKAEELNDVQHNTFMAEFVTQLRNSYWKTSRRIEEGQNSPHNPQPLDEKDVQILSESVYVFYCSLSNHIRNEVASRVHPIVQEGLQEANLPQGEPRAEASAADQRGLKPRQREGRGG